MSYWVVWLQNVTQPWLGIRKIMVHWLKIRGNFNCHRRLIKSYLQFNSRIVGAKERKFVESSNDISIQALTVKFKYWPTWWLKYHALCRVHKSSAYRQKTAESRRRRHLVCRSRRLPVLSAQTVSAWRNMSAGIDKERIPVSMCRRIFGTRLRVDRNSMWNQSVIISFT